MSAVLPGWAPLVARHRNVLLHFGAGPDLVASRAPRGRPVYLASPYSKRVISDETGDWDPHLSMLCALEAAEFAAVLMRFGVTALSPIAQAHLMVRAVIDGPMRVDPLAQAEWGDWCRPILAACGAVLVLDLPGWAESVGVLGEVSGALAQNKQVFIAAFALPEGSA
jgi:hypothetical protein